MLRGLAIPAAACLATALAPAWVTVGDPATFWLARALAVAAMLGVVAQSWRGSLPAAISPAVLLPALTLVLYSLIPAVYAAGWLGPPLLIPPQVDPLSVRSTSTGVLLFVRYGVTSEAERLVLGFIGAAFGLALAFARAMPPRRAAPAPVPAGWGLALVVVAGLCFRTGKAGLAAGLLPAGAGALIDALPGAVALGMAVVVQAALAEGGRKVLAALLALGLGAGLLFPFLIKTAVLLCGTALLAMVAGLSGRLRLALIALLALMPVAGTIGLGLARDNIRSDRFFTRIGETLLSKLVERQAETVFCLNFVMEDALDPATASQRRQPAYFFAGLVPRALWPGKPSLSAGAEHSRRYCGVVQPPPGSGMPLHSAAITLLGEPLLHGGTAGLTLAGLVLAAISGAVMWAWRRGGGFVPAVAVAVSPWLLDFDQHFAMYLANAAKALLAAAAAAAALALIRRRRADWPH